MKQSDIFSILSENLKLNPHLKPLKENIKVSLVSDEISKIKKNSIFIAIQGQKFNGNQWIKKALNQGALWVVLEVKEKKKKYFKENFFKKSFNQFFFVKDSRKAFSKLCTNFYKHPSQKLFCIGITGTNGKTTVTSMVEHIFLKFFKTGVIGTIDHHIKNEKTWKTKLTTPKCNTLQKRLSDFVKRHVKVCAMEVSSHAISQKRIDDISFNALAFTHFHQDHLDYHKSLKNYFLVKESLFNHSSLQPNTLQLKKNNPTPQSEGSFLLPPKPFAVINRDNPFIKKLKTKKGLKIFTYGRRNKNLKLKNDFSFKILNMNLKETKIEIKNPKGERKKIQLPIFGEHNIYNATSAIALSYGANIPFDKALKALKTFPGVSGRLEKIKNKKGIHVFVDYAHNESGLFTILKNFQKLRKKAKKPFKIISLFGCGGGRDREKRSPMTKVALKYSNHVFLTSDNPRNEDPKKIIEESLKGLRINEKKEKLVIEINRKKAIFKALKKSKKGDIVVVFGKGHENVQITKKGSHPFSDKKVIESFFSS